MAAVPLMIVNVGYRSTNFWVLSAGNSRLLVDLGWPGTLGTMLAMLGRKDVPIAEVTHGLATHYHPDHAGLAQELKQQGMRLLVPLVQVQTIGQMKQWMKPGDHYVDITLDDNLTFPLDQSRQILRSIGFDGEIIHTPGHSGDSVSLVLDNGCAFTGDLTLPRMASDEGAEAIARSWKALRDHGATRVYPGHGPIGSMPIEERQHRE